jgi:hypothetical protein
MVMVAIFMTWPQHLRKGHNHAITIKLKPACACYILPCSSSQAFTEVQWSVNDVKTLLNLHQNLTTHHIASHRNTQPDLPSHP